MANKFSVFTVFRGDDAPLVNACRNSGKWLKDLGQTSRSTGRALAAALGKGALTVGKGALLKAGSMGFEALAGSVGGAVEEMLSSERELVRAGTKFGDPIRKGTAAYQELRQAANQASMSGLVTSSEAATGLADLASAGLSAGAAVKALPTALALSRVAGINMSDSVKTLADAMTGIGLPSGTDDEIQSSMSKIADAFGFASDATTAEIKDIGDAFKVVGPIAQGFGLSLADTTGAIGLLAKAGIKGPEAGTALKGVFASLTATTGMSLQAMKKLGVQVVKNDEGGLNFAATIAKVAQATSKMDKVQRMQVATQIAGREGATAFSAILNMGADKLQEFSKGVDGAAGGTMMKFGILTDTTEAKLGKLKNSATNIFSSLGAGIADAWGPTIDRVARFAGVMGEVLTSNKELQDVMVGGLADTVSGFFDMIVGGAGLACREVKKLGLSIENLGDLIWGGASDDLKAQWAAVDADYAESAKTYDAGKARFDKGLANAKAGGKGLYDAASKKLAEEDAGMSLVDASSDAGQKRRTRDWISEVTGPADRAPAEYGARDFTEGPAKPAIQYAPPVDLSTGNPFLKFIPNLSGGHDGRTPQPRGQQKVVVDLKLPQGVTTADGQNKIDSPGFTLNLLPSGGL